MKLKTRKIIAIRLIFHTLPQKTFPDAQSCSFSSSYLVFVMFDLVLYTVLMLALLISTCLVMIMIQRASNPLVELDFSDT